MSTISMMKNLQARGLFGFSCEGGWRSFRRMNRVALRRRRLLLVAGAAILSLGCAAPALAANEAARVVPVDLRAELVMTAAAPSRFAEAAQESPLLSVPVADTAAVEVLPDAPSALMEDGPQSMSGSTPAPTTAQPRVIGKRFKYIPSGFTAQPINGREKVVVGLRDLISPFNFLGMISSALYSQWTNGEPNYGTNSGAFAQRFGAAAIRESSQGLFTDAVFCPLLRQDPRYYVEGPQYGFWHRTFYAATRPLVGRTDSGKNTVNSALLLGYASAAALSYAYYPQSNQNFHDTASTFGGSIGGAALGFWVAEFSDQVLEAFHLKKQQ
jgi:hypothetical protein